MTVSTFHLNKDDSVFVEVYILSHCSPATWAFQREKLEIAISLTGINFCMDFIYT